MSERRGAANGSLGTMSSATPRFCAACAGGAANDKISSKVHRRESCLASLHIKPISPPRHAEGVCLPYLSDDFVSPFLPDHLAPVVRRHSFIALRLGGAFEFFGLPPSRFVAYNETL